MRRIALGMAVVAVLAAAGAFGALLLLRDSTETAFKWMALGDSYSSGLGEIEKPLECARDVEVSYVGRAADLLRSDGYRPSVQLPACSGAKLDNVFVAQSAVAPAQIDSVDASVDVVTFTFGGDDIGFGSVVSSCVSTHFGSRLSALLDDAAVARDCAVDPDNPVNIGEGEDGWKGVEDELVKVIDAVLAKMSPTGHLFALSYPNMFANPDTWSGTSCFGFNAANARAFNLGVIRMGDAIDRAVQRATPSAAKAHFVDWREETSESEVWGSHGLCGDEASWVHGFRLLEPGGLSASRANSFHPTTEGYAKAGELLAEAIDDALG